jgi:hypothetical protein
MNLPSLRELVEIGGGADRVATHPAGIRVSGGAYGPDRDLHERIAFYGMPLIVVDFHKPDDK